MADKIKYMPKGKPFDELTADEQRTIAQKGGKASGDARREKRALRDMLQKLLSSDFDIDGQKLNGAEAASVALIKQALAGNVRAFEVIRDTIGEKPADKVNIETNEAVRKAYEKAAAAIKDVN